MTQTNIKKIQEKLAKLEALIASTSHEGERRSAILARDRLLKKILKHKKHQNKSSKKKKHQEIDEFFYREENAKRSPDDTSKASFAQKRFICSLVKTAKLSCTERFLRNFLQDLGLEQASRVIENLIEIGGDPRERPATDRQVKFLKKNMSFGLNEELIGMLKSFQASKIIGGIKMIQEIEDSIKDPETQKLKQFFSEN